jgi:DNA-binding GntR family transcriptional regulator
MERLPHYRRLYEQLRKHITKGVYKKGDILPSENELCSVNNVTRPTVRKALDMLANEGFITKHQGLGSVVNNIPKGVGILSIKGTTSAVGIESLQTKTIVKPNVIAWPENFVFPLTELELESGCIYFERLRLVDGEPFFYDITYIPNINLPRFTSYKLDDVSLFDTLRENFQLEVKGGKQHFKAVLPDSNMLEQLRIDKQQPIIQLQRKFNTNRLNFNFYSELYCNTELYALSGRF